MPFLAALELQGYWWEPFLLVSPAALYIGGIITQAREEERRWRQTRPNYYRKNLELIDSYCNRHR